MDKRFQTICLNVLFAFLTFVTIQSIAQNTSDKKVVGNEIEKYLLETEAIRTTDFDLFTNNLSTITQSQIKLSVYQSCFLEYLNSYKIGYQGNFSEAKQKLNELFYGCNDLKIKIRIQALLANLNIISRNYALAIESLDYIESNFDKINDKTTRHIAYTVFFITYSLLEQWELTIKFSDLLIDDNPTEQLLCKASVNKYTALFHKGEKIDKDQISRVINHCRNINENLFAQALNIKWLRYNVEHTDDFVKLKQFLEQLSEADNEVNQTKYKNLISLKNALYAQIYDKMGMTKLAVDYAQLSIEQGKSIGSTEQEIFALNVLVNHYQSIGDYQTANQYLNQKYEAQHEFYSDKQAKQMAYQTIRHDNLAKNHRIQSLSQQNDLLKLKNELSEKSRTNQILINSIMAVLLIILLYIGYKIKRQQQQFKKLSELDHMTYILNRKGAKNYMEYLLPYSEKKGETVAYGIFDLDHFKEVNDLYGHLIGDWVIKKSISVCQSLTFEKVTFARIGGEEFAIIIRDSSLEEIKEIAEKYRQAISQIETKEETGHDFSITASFGVTTTETAGYNYLNLMKVADTALYKAKNNGRNQVAIYQEPIDNLS